MTKLMQTASGLTLAAALATAPLMALAQQQSTESDAEQAVEEVVQETEEAAGEAAQAVGEAAQDVEQGAEQAAQEVQQGAEQTTQEVELEVEESEQPMESAEGEVQELEVEVIEGSDQETQILQTQQGDGTVDPATNVQVTDISAGGGDVPGAIRLQDEDSILTSELLDGSVYSMDGEKIGDIDDAIVSLDGTVEGVVIGVGGFLGIGEKHVAVEMQQISVRMDERGQPQLILDSTREALESAPEFVTAKDQRNEAARQDAVQQVPGAAPVENGMLTSDPAQPGMAPAPAAESEQPVIIQQD